MRRYVSPVKYIVPEKSIKRFSIYVDWLVAYALPGNYTKKNGPMV